MAKDTQIAQIAALPFTLAMSMPCKLDEISTLLEHENPCWNPLQERSFPHILSNHNVGHSMMRIDARVERDGEIHFLSMEPAEALTIDEVAGAIHLEPSGRKPVSYIPDIQEMALIYQTLSCNEVHFVYEQSNREIQRIVVKKTVDPLEMPELLLNKEPQAVSV